MNTSKMEESVTVSGGDNDTFHRFAVGDEQNLLLYLLRAIPDGHKGVSPSRPALSGVQVTLAGRIPGMYKIAVWNTKTGKMLAQRTAQVQGGADTLTVGLPSVREEIALAVVRA